MKKEFKIFKKGVTSGKRIIFSKNGEPFNKKDKIRKYLILGYKVFNMDDKEITSM